MMSIMFTRKYFSGWERNVIKIEIPGFKCIVLFSPNIIQLRYQDTPFKYYDIVMGFRLKGCSFHYPHQR